MSEKNFDQRLRSVLEQLEPPYDASSWALLERKLDALTAAPETPFAAADEAVDEAVLPALQRLEAPYEAAHWNLLAQQLNTQAFRLRRLRIAKVTEAALLALILWNSGLFLNNGAGYVFPLPQRQPNVPVAGVRPGRPAQQGAGAADLAAGRSIAQDALLEFLETPAAGFVLSNDYKTAPNLPSVLNGLNGLVYQAQPRMYASADLLPCDALAALAAPDRALVFSPIAPKKRVESGPFYLAASISGNQNRVLVNGARRNSPGYGGALALGFRAGAWGVEAGIGYAHQRYTPKREVEIYGGNLANGYYGSTLTEVSADQLTVPLKVTRRLARLGKTSLHAVGGLTANVAAEKSYDYGTVYYAPDVLPPNFLPAPNQSPKLRQSGQGVLENGRLEGNFYATVDAGLRLERPIARSRFTAFVEPAYRQSITGKGPGPKREPINTFSLQAGVLAFL